MVVLKIIAIVVALAREMAIVLEAPKLIAQVLDRAGVLVMERHLKMPFCRSTDLGCRGELSDEAGWGSGSNKN